MQEIIEIKERIDELKRHLIATDYMVLKYVEGQLSEEEYQSIKAERQSWRDEINALEGQLNG